MIDAVKPGGNHEFRLSELLESPTMDAVKKEEPLHKRLLVAAVTYLRESGIRIPYATLEVRGNNVVMHGVPQTGELLVCACEGAYIENHL